MYLRNNNPLPDTLNSEKKARLNSINFSHNDILKTIRPLHVYKAHDFDDISI